MENLQLDRENTGNSKIQFEWVPCRIILGENCEIMFDVALHGNF